MTEVKPMRADARRNYERLLEEARRAFAEHGVEASLEDIARRAGVGIGTLYRHFPTRDALLEALLRDRFDTQAERARELLAHPEPLDRPADLARRPRRHHRHLPRALETDRRRAERRNVPFVRVVPRNARGRFPSSGTGAAGGRTPPRRHHARAASLAARGILGGRTCPAAGPAAPPGSCFRGIASELTPREARTGPAALNSATTGAQRRAETVCRHTASWK